MFEGNRKFTPSRLRKRLYELPEKYSGSKENIAVRLAEIDSHSERLAVLAKLLLIGSGGFAFFIVSTYETLLASSRFFPHGVPEWLGRDFLNATWLAAASLLVVFWALFNAMEVRSLVALTRCAISVDDDMAYQGARNELRRWLTFSSVLIHLAILMFAITIMIAFGALGGFLGTTADISVVH